ncbi:hypothetical protein GCM10011352_35050 [Marinobacterium zhoushanense]|uniref:Uncharacterized protein n=1 Tax=Marinobacterium zhoushanense TaxID=1679163 RepID=A0ABQ1KSG5_9GAMM|nr:hypothetical protein GCM10011352_35050 [Marinobacterium zhoushanense]
MAVGAECLGTGGGESAVAALQEGGLHRFHAMAAAAELCVRGDMQSRIRGCPREQGSQTEQGQYQYQLDCASHDTEFPFPSEAFVF